MLICWRSLLNSIMRWRTQNPSLLPTAMSVCGSRRGCGNMCGRESRRWCDVHRVAPNKDGNGKILSCFVWILLCPVDNSRNQGINQSYEIISPGSYPYIDCLVDQLIFGRF